MAVLEQAIALTSLRNFLYIPQNPNSRLIVPSGARCTNYSLTSAPSIYSRCWRQSKTKWNSPLLCSMDGFKEQSYNSDLYNQIPVGYPKPSKIPFNRELSNSVNLIGIVTSPVEIRHFATGKVTAWTRITVKKNATQAFGIRLAFWDELAHVAFQHLQKGREIHVSGRIVADIVDDGNRNTYFKVVCRQLNFIEPSSSPSYNQESNSMIFGSQSVEESWQAFFANPAEWWDNRRNKWNPRYPDFKHKDTGEALWVEGRFNPPWVKSQLAILDARMGSHFDQNGNNMPANMVTVDELLSF